MAQVLLERMLARHGVDGAIRVRSGGIANYARDGMIASLDARLALREEGIQLARTISSRPTSVATAISSSGRT